MQNINQNSTADGDRLCSPKEHLIQLVAESAILLHSHRGGTIVKEKVISDSAKCIILNSSAVSNKSDPGVQKPKEHCQMISYSEIMMQSNWSDTVL